MDTAPNMGELESWKRQETTFCVVQLAVLAVLLLIHTLFADHFGLPSRTLLAVLAGAFLLRVLQMIWIQARQHLPSRKVAGVVTFASVILNLVLAFAADTLTDRPDSQYFVLLVMPVVECAFRFSLLITAGVLVATCALNFLWIAHFASIHGPVEPDEYFEAGSISMIFAFVGILVWTLVQNLRANQAALANNLLTLQQTQDKLLREEKLAAVGRLSSAVAHEIRNPVAMISSALGTAVRGQLPPEQREKMFEIASVQAERLEKLTNDFLSYARPRALVKQRNDMKQVLSYIAELSRARAAEQNLTVAVECPVELNCDCDLTVLQQALLNLLMNAMDASQSGSTIRLRAHESTESIDIDVENDGPAIDWRALEQIFEPFFTTKPRGTGLGLAIARNAARSHGGDLTLSQNGPTTVRFTLSLPASKTALHSWQEPRLWPEY
jgi:signal transduction histidine kinase